MIAIVLHLVDSFVGLLSLCLYREYGYLGGSIGYLRVGEVQQIGCQYGSSCMAPMVCCQGCQDHHKNCHCLDQWTGPTTEIISSRRPHARFRMMRVDWFVLFRRPNRVFSVMLCTSESHRR